MRRADREVTAKEDISAVMEKCDAVSVAFAGETPYVIPMSFGSEWAGECPTLYLHGAAEGEKVSRMRRDDRALAAVSVWKNDVRQIGGKWRKHL